MTACVHYVKELMVLHMERDQLPTRPYYNEHTLPRMRTTSRGIDAGL